MSELKTIAFLGAGVMGAPMAKNLGKAGFEVRLWNRSEDKAQAASGGGVTAVSSIKEALSGADVLITMLTDAASVKDVMESAKDHLEPSTVWAQMSTVGAKIDDLKHMADQLGVTMID